MKRRTGNTLAGLVMVAAIALPLCLSAAQQRATGQRPQLPAAEVQGALNVVVRVLAQNAEERTGVGLTPRQRDHLAAQFYNDVRALGVYEFTQAE